MGNIGAWELIIIVVLLLVIFGGKWLAALGRGLGQAVAGFRRKAGKANAPPDDSGATQKSD